VPAIYEAAVTGDGVRVRADVLVRVPGEPFDLIEVKSTASVKPEHEWDVAVQLHAFEAAGLPIRRAYLMHLDRSYVYWGGDHDVERLFTLEDLTEGVRARREDVRRALEAMRAALRSGEMPAIAVGPHCDEPYTCPFYERCHDGLPEDPFAVLPRLSRKLRERITSAGIGSLDELPVEFGGLSLIQRRALEALRSGSRVIDPGIREGR
jgi:CRISPR/Cas system-associated exonuclease Cas4 (RecB family)